MLLTNSILTPVHDLELDQINITYCNNCILFKRKTINILVFFREQFMPVYCFIYCRKTKPGGMEHKPPEHSAFNKFRADTKQPGGN